MQYLFLYISSKRIVIFLVTCNEFFVKYCIDPCFDCCIKFKIFASGTSLLVQKQMIVGWGIVRGAALAVPFYAVRNIITECVMHLYVHFQGNSIVMVLSCPTSLLHYLASFTMPHKSTLIIPVCFISLQQLIHVSKAWESYFLCFISLHPLIHVSKARKVTF